MRAMGEGQLHGRGEGQFHGRDRGGAVKHRGQL